MSKKKSPKKELKPFTCCLCGLEIDDEEGNNPEPLFYAGDKQENKCCDFCFEIVIRVRDQIDILVEQGVDDCVQSGISVENLGELSSEIEELREKVEKLESLLLDKKVAPLILQPKPKASKTAKATGTK